MLAAKSRKMEIVKRDDSKMVVKSLEYPPRLTEADVACFRAITSQELTPEQVRRIVTPLEVMEDE